MKYFREISTVVLFLFLGVTAHSQQNDKLYFADTLSNVTKANMFYTMALDEPDGSEKQTMLRMSLEHFEKAYNNSQIHTLTDSLDVLIHLAECYAYIDSLNVCTQTLQKAIDLAYTRCGKETPTYADLLRRIAAICNIAGDYAQAELFLDKCKEHFKQYSTGKYEGFTPQTYTLYLRVRALNEMAAERYRSALKYSQETHEIITEEKLSSLIYLENLATMAYLYGKMNRFGMMSKCYNLLTSEYKETIRTRLTKMSEARRNVYWENVSTSFEEIAEGYAWTSYNACLFSKGLLLNTAIEFRERIEKSENLEAKAALSVLDSLIATGADTRQIDSVDLAIVKLIGKDHNTNLQFNDITWKDVQHHLGNDDLAIEFVATRNGTYRALLLRKGWKAPQAVAIWNNKKGIKILKDLKNSNNPHEYINQNSREVSEAIWVRRIRRHFPLTENGKIYFSADGILHQIGIEYLPLYTGENETDNSSIIDNYKIYRLSSTREIIRLSDDSRQENASASLYGGARFNPFPRQLRHAVSQISVIDTSLVDKRFEETVLAEYTESGNTRANSEEGRIHVLPNTIKEVHEIDSLLSVAGKESSIYTGVYANEESFKTKTFGKNIIHVATHGFYVSAVEALSSNEYYKSRFAHNPTALSDPMYRSGFLLAGAAPAWAGISNYVGLEDGVVTAKEISLMNLADADLVVLSACQTATGDVLKDGVYGLQRAFKNAGAKSIIMSLWKVDDEATYLMMSCFYKNRFELGMSKYDAFTAALRQIRTKFPESSHWKSFILLDPEIR